MIGGASDGKYSTLKWPLLQLVVYMIWQCLTLSIVYILNVTNEGEN